MRRDILDVIESFTSHGFAVTIASNGTLISKELADAIAQKVSGISISLDGFATAHNQLRGAKVFEQAVRTIELLRAVGVAHLGIKT